jgi:hypothetical protein
MRKLRQATFAAMILLMGGAPARAEVLLTGFAGVTFEGDSNGSQGHYGGSLGFLGAGVVGFEVEFATTPDFFGGVGNEGVFTDNNVVTLMGSLLLAVPAGPVRIYGAAGAGLFKPRLQDEDRLFNIDSNDFGINVGGGIIGYLGEHFGLRADIRYFRDLSDPEADDDFDIDFGNVDYWRAYGGIVIKF